MDAESLKIILDLKKENVFLHRAIIDAICMLSGRKRHFVLEYPIESDAGWLFERIETILNEIEDNKHPASQTNQSNNSTC
jgi:hypothetical protein